MSKKKRILVVEDNRTLLETLAYNLKGEGYKTLTVEDGRAALEVARDKKPALIILDVMLPGMDGFEVCRLLRKEHNVPILMLTARGEEIDRIVGLEMGADDYLTKPFSMRELMARVKALLRRVDMVRQDVEAEAHETGRPQKPVQMTFDNLTIDEFRREIRLDGKPLREKIEPDPGRAVRITTVRGVGYRFDG